jgi:hypothetical protein
MNLKDKLKGIPDVYYVNLDNRIDRKEYMESQFDYWGIENYHRVSATKYLASEFDKWKHIIRNEKNYTLDLVSVANFISNIETIKNWLETSKDEYFILMEDDYDLSLIEYWNFNWDYLINHIPYDWDCIQLGFESSGDIHFFLHPKRSNTCFGACLINRHYAKKLLSLYFKEGLFILDNEINGVHCGYLDHTITNNGKVYCIPLIPQNPYFTSYENYDTRENHSLEIFFNTYNLYHDWWKNEHHKFSLEDFFRYEKKNDFEMTRNTNLKIFAKTLIKYN